MIVWIAAAVLGGVVVAAVHRPTFFLLGWRYMRANPRQGAVAVVGLMVGMAVLVGTGITTDSASAEMERQLAARRGVTDAALRFTPTPIADVQSWLDAPDVANGVVAAGLAYRARDAAVDPLAGVGVSDVTVLGIDAGYRGAVEWTEVSSAPGEGVALTRSLADALGVTAGDMVRMYLPPSPQAEPRYEHLHETLAFNGTLVAAAVGPDGPVHSDEDVYRFGLVVPGYATGLWL